MNYKTFNTNESQITMLKKKARHKKVHTIIPFMQNFRTRKTNSSEKMQINGRLRPWLEAGDLWVRDTKAILGDDRNFLYLDCGDG